VRSDIEADEHADYTLHLDTPDLSYNINDYLIKSTPAALFLYKPPLMHTERHTPEDFLCLEDVVDKDYKLLSRLDYGVDGVIAALHRDVALASQRKSYLAWVEGEFDRTGTSFWEIDASHRRKVQAEETYNGAYMHFTLRRVSDDRSLIEIQLESAARHQVRAVCAAMGHPIIGDYIYGDASEAGRILLHCYRAEVNEIAAVSPYLEDFTNS
jgi:23S rRNA-/tRNA-specific pseudouridylate synthase